MDVWTRTKVTAICVTHDVDEAILLADRVVMMSNGPNARSATSWRWTCRVRARRKALLAHPRLLRLPRRASRLPRSLRGRRQSGRRHFSKQSSASAPSGSMSRSETAHPEPQRNKSQWPKNSSSSATAWRRAHARAPVRKGARAAMTSRSSTPSRASTTTASCSRRCCRAKRDYEEIIIHGDGWYIEHGITLYKGHKVAAIDRDAKTVTSDHGVTESLRQAGHRHRLGAASSCRCRATIFPASSPTATSTTCKPCCWPPSRATRRSSSAAACSASRRRQVLPRAAWT